MFTLCVDGCEDGLLACLAGCRVEKASSAKCRLVPQIAGGRVAAAVGPTVVAPSGGGLGPPRVDVYVASCAPSVPPSQAVAWPACSHISLVWSGLVRPFHVAAGPGKTLRASMQTSNRPAPINPSSSLQSQTLSQLYLPRPRRRRLTNEMENRCLMPGCLLAGAAPSFMLACLLA